MEEIYRQWRLRRMFLQFWTRRYKENKNKNESRQKEEKQKKEGFEIRWKHFV